MNTNEHLQDWLRDAHSMEMEAASIMDKQAMRLDGYPALQQRIRQHVEETKVQAERLQALLAGVDSGSSGLKDLMGKFMGNMAAITSSMASDEVVKSILADYAYEHFEIACYRSLIAGAEALGHHQIADVCRTILREEEAMASFLEQHIPDVTRMFLERDAADVHAKN